MLLTTTTGMQIEGEIQRLLTATHIEEWLQEDVFHVTWWLLLGLSIFAIIVWWKMLDKTRLPEIILYAVLMMIVMMGIDEYGEELTLWDYPRDILPIFPVITAINLSILPLAYSVIYQNFHTWKSFAGTSIGIAGLLSFILEPAMVWGNLYQLLKWKYYYNFLIYITIALIIRWTVVKIYRIAEHAPWHPN